MEKKTSDGIKKKADVFEVRGARERRKEVMDRESKREREMSFPALFVTASSPQAEKGGREIKEKKILFFFSTLLLLLYFLLWLYWLRFYSKANRKKIVLKDNTSHCGVSG